METFCATSGIDVADLHLLSASPLKSGFCRAFNKRSHKLTLVVHRAPHIGLRVGSCARGIGGRFDQLWPQLPAPKRCFRLPLSNLHPTKPTQSTGNLGAP